MKLRWGPSFELPLPGFTRNRPQFSQSRRALLVLGATLTIVSLYLLYAGFALSTRDSAYPASQRTLTSFDAYERKEGYDIGKLRQITASTAGFFARDWSLYLGWNNVEYCTCCANFSRPDELHSYDT